MTSRSARTRFIALIVSWADGRDLLREIVRDADERPRRRVETGLSRLGRNDADADVADAFRQIADLRIRRIELVHRRLQRDLAARQEVLAVGYVARHRHRGLRVNAQRAAESLAGRNVGEDDRFIAEKI